MLIAEHTATIEACRFCFMCRHVCTLGVVSGKESDTPRGRGLILFQTLKGHVAYSPDLVDTVYRCCLCGYCQTWCQAKCTPPAAVLAARADIVAQGLAPAAVQEIKARLLATGNPFGRPAEERFQALESEGLFRPRAEVLYYVGCDTAYERPEIARAMIHLLRAAKADFTLLPQERSTGKPLYLLGYRDEARAMAEQLTAQIRATGCRRLVTTCPSALDAFLTDYPALRVALDGVEVLHAAQYLDRLAEEGRLPLQRKTSASMTLLDAGYLGRGHKILDQPRRLLGRMSDSPLREMGWTRELAYSCGEAGGVLRLLHPELSQQLAARVWAEAQTTGADVLVTTCPVTKTALGEARASQMAVRDLVEVAAEALGG
jgi:Fe-S oxidoreductase